MLAQRSERPGTLRDRWNQSWIVALLLLLAVAAAYHLHRIRPVPLERDLHTIPTQIGNWIGRDIDLQSVPFRIQGADEEIARLYRSTSGPAVILYVAYLEAQEQGRELVSYVSRKLLAGATSVSVRTADGRSRDLNRTVFQVGQQIHLVLFWYEVSGGPVANPYRVKLRTIWGGMSRRKTNGAMVAAFTELKQPRDLQRMFDHSISFVRELTPRLQHFLP